MIVTSWEIIIPNLKYISQVRIKDCLHPGEQASYDNNNYYW